ncbi:MAG: hypothetical protein AB7S77_16480 [Desulfatirhabdiaceae bacterium]
MLVEYAASENNGGNMTFPGGAQTHDKPKAALFKIALNRMRNNGRIEQSGRFNGILLCKISADQCAFSLTLQYAFFNMSFYQAEVFFENVIQVFMPPGKVRYDLC